ncbi:MAG: helix-turn-helix domain containing protein [Acidocella sp.]|nr:helix-turn-helix domain containing protein [Acidocella sp.]
MPNKHAQRTQVTHELLLRAAKTIFIRDGYEGAELGEIAALAGRTKGAIYAHFKSKEDIFLALIEERRAMSRAQMEVLLAGSTSTEQNRATFRSFCLEMVEDPEWPLLLLEFKLFAMRHPESKARLEEFDSASYPGDPEKRFSELLGHAKRGKNSLSRSAAVKTLMPLLSALAVESRFAPTLLDAATRRKVAERIFDALVPTQPD